MLDLCQNVLQKVSFSKTLFRKELIKSMKWLTQKEQLALQAWCMSRFGNEYQDIISEIFKQGV
jgi:hypothetical protein